ncbi:glycosyltransferase family 39 protein [Candidatus Uhrbacteria bacterium]|nr:glycosyltransferase family 39 protein [Candidatus Uhrbacteria bacterium]
MPERLSTLEPPLVSAGSGRISKAAVILVALAHSAFIFFVSLSFPRGIYNSPDEAANALFARQMQQATSVRVPTLIKDAPAFVAPRSIKRAGNTFIPVGFISFPTLFGILAKALGTTGTLALTAILSGLTVGAWYGFIRRIFGATIGLFSAILYGLHPAVLYWGARPFYPHALFISTTILALYFLGRTVRLRHERGAADQEILKENPTASQPLVKKRAASFLAGLMAGVAVTLRPTEGLWLAPVFFAVFALRALRRRVALIPLALGGLFPIFAILALQNRLYGSPFKTGYPELFQPKNLADTVSILVTPFGFDLARTAQVGWEYLARLFWWYALLIVIGVAALFLRKSTTARRMRWWGLGVLLLTLFFLQFYGSWLLRDRLDLLPSLGTSFTRYFLPLYLLTTPLAAYGLRVIQFRRFGKILAVCAGIFFLFFSARTLLWSSDENLVELNAVLRENIKVREHILSLTPADSIILTDRADKIIFPSREVVARFRDLTAEQFRELRPYPLYYETILNEMDVAKENEQFWRRAGLYAADMILLPGRHRLYKLVKLGE